jgi:hypothetical protein
MTALIPPKSTEPVTKIVSRPPIKIKVSTRSVHRIFVFPVMKKGVDTIDVEQFSQGDYSIRWDFNKGFFCFMWLTENICH